MATPLSSEARAALAEIPPQWTDPDAIDSLTVAEVRELVGIERGRGRALASCRPASRASASRSGGARQRQRRPPLRGVFHGFVEWLDAIPAAAEFVGEIGRLQPGARPSLTAARRHVRSSIG
ncbi:MAG: hypothetical protein U0R71_11845 [Solirubrobacterales bacterium]